MNDFDNCVFSVSSPAINNTLYADAGPRISVQGSEVIKQCVAYSFIANFTC